MNIQKIFEFVRMKRRIQMKEEFRPLGMLLMKIVYKQTDKNFNKWQEIWEKLNSSKLYEVRWLLDDNVVEKGNAQ